MRKPDPGMWQLGLDLLQVSAAESIYVDDRAMFVDCAAEMGFAAVHHVSLQQTASAFEVLGLITT
jgi:putative hydrolase of the HAD superfamily